ncbi:unnamed protein product [Effrenium voratum]|nr:unnamed protein product [Effrenium voratum]
MAGADWGGHSGSRLGLDVGGTLTKLVFFESETRPSWCNGHFAQVIKTLGIQALRSEAEGSGKDFCRQCSFWGERDRGLGFYDADLKGSFHFLCFSTDKMERFVGLLAEQDLHHQIDEIYSTGGGAYKYAKLFQEVLGITLKPVDELGVVIKGISWLLRREIAEEVCWLSEKPKKSLLEMLSEETVSECHFVDTNNLFPFILVNIGSGVSIVRVDGTDKFERISGSALGGGTFWGLCNLLCPERTDFAAAGALADSGDASKVNLLVEDIYGGDYELAGGKKLPGTLTASFFAKAGRNGGEANDADVLRALITMISQNICQIAFLNSRLHGITRIVFTGNFLRHNPVAGGVIADNMRRVSATALPGKKLEALFLLHEGYFGALGSFLQNVEGENAEIPSCQRLPAPLPTLLGKLAACSSRGKPGAIQRTWRSFGRCFRKRECGEGSGARA